MEFSIWCPVDGSVTVGLDDIDSIVVRSGSDVEVVFVCPQCGGHVSLVARVPKALLAVLDEDWVREEGEDGPITLRREDLTPHPEEPEADRHVEAYCEYFRRELEGVDTVEAMLVEIDQREKR